MADVKKDIWAPTPFGSTELSKSIVDATSHRARRVARVTGLSGTRTSEAEAIAAVEAAIGSFHPDLSALPLFRVRARRYGATTAWVSAEYRRDQRRTSQQAERTVTLRTGVEGIPWYRMAATKDAPSTETFDANGFPNGDFYDLATSQLADRKRVPQPYTWARPRLDIFVFTDLDFDPTADVFDRVGKANSDAVTWGSYSFPQNTLVFNGALVDWYELESSDVRYSTQYHFTAIRGGWRKQLVYFNETPDPSEWDTEIVNVYQLATFAGQFPVGN